MDDQPWTPETVIEETLNHYPLEPLPEHFVDQVMTRIRVLALEPAQVRFRLDFLDWAIPLFSAFFALILIGLIRRWAFWDGLFWNDVSTTLNPDWLFIIGLIVIAETVLAGMVGVWLWFDKPLPIVRL
jgi:hypothetical protein